jgi:hypothetical protein
MKQVRIASLRMRFLRPNTHAVLRRHISNESSKIPTRTAMISSMSDGREFDLLIIGAGATGSGI